MNNKKFEVIVSLINDMMTNDEIMNIVSVDEKTINNIRTVVNCDDNSLDKLVNHKISVEEAENVILDEGCGVPTLNCIYGVMWMLNDNSECSCGVCASSSAFYNRIHNLLEAVDSHNEKITFQNIIEICNCTRNDIYAFLRSQYNCGDFKRVIKTTSKKELKANNLNRMLKIAKEYSEKNGGITLKKLEKLTGLSYATIHNYVNKNEELEGYIKYLRK